MKLKKWNGSSWVQEYPEVDVNSIVATGTPSSTTYLRGDGSWATVTSGTTFTGGTITGNIEISNTLPKITFTDTDHNSDFNIANNNGVFTIGDTTNQLDRFRIYSSGDVEITGSSVDISGVTLFNDNGTLKWDGTIVSLNGHTHTFASLTSKPTTLSGYGITDAYSSSNPSGYQTAAQVASTISALVDSAPSTLDTLNELAAALGDDPNFATTVTNNIATKVSKSGDTMTGSLTINSSGTIGGATLGNGWLKVGTTLAMDPNEIYFGTVGYVGTIGANDLIFMQNSTERLRATSSGISVTGSITEGGSTLASKYAPISHTHGRLYSETGTTTNYIRLNATNELELYNGAGAVIPLYLNYSGAYNSLLGPGGGVIFHDGYHPNADKLTTERNIALTGAVTGNADFDGSGNISIATTATADPTLTINGDASGSATFTNLGNATLTLTVADNSHNHSSVTDYAPYLYTRDNRTISPSEDGAYRLRYGFTSWNNNNTSPYADYLHLRSYSDSSGGSDNLVMFKKSGIGMRIWQQSFGSSTAYSNYVDVIDSSTIGSQSVNYASSAGNANTVDNYHIVVGSTGTDANTLYFTT